MGGFGSGRRYGKNTTDSYRTLDVRRLQRDGLLIPGHAFGWNWTRNGETVASIQMKTETDRVNLMYSHRSGGGEWKREEYPVLLDWTPCNYGSRRAWFRCPAAGCGRRVALVYLGGAGIFSCRHCNRLAYRVERESDGDRAARRANRIRERLGWDMGIFNPAGSKPSGMHWRTFERLAVEHYAHVDIVLGGLAQRFCKNSHGME